MFTNIGKKIKYISLIVFGVIVFCVFIGAVTATTLMIGSSNNPDAGEIIAAAFVFLIIMALGIFFAWLAVLFIYAKGELVDSNQIQVKQNDLIIKLLAGKEVKMSEIDLQASLQSESHSKLKYNEYKYGQAMDIPSNEPSPEAEQNNSESN